MAAIVAASVQRLGFQSIGRNDFGDEAAALGLRGVHHPAGEAKLHRLGFADRPRQALRAAGAGHDPQFDLGLAEFGRVGGENNIAHQGELAAAAQRKAGDRGDDRLSDLREMLPIGEKIFEIGAKRKSSPAFR